MGVAFGLLALALGFVLGRLSVRRYRRDRIAWAQRRLQLQVLSIELKSLAQQGGVRPRTAHAPGRAALGAQARRRSRGGQSG